MSVFVGRRRILLSHSITMQSTHSTVAGCQKRQVHHAGHLNKKQEIGYASTTQEAVPQRCKILETSYVREHCIRNKNQIWHGAQTRCWKFLYGRPRMLARDRFAVDNLVETEITLGCETCNSNILSAESCAYTASISDRYLLRKPRKTLTEAPSVECA